jgi:hypothetical protein
MTGPQDNRSNRRACGVALLWALSLVGCGGGGGGGGGEPSGEVRVSGRISFDRVPTDSATSGLDYGNVSAEPARGVVVEAVDTTGRVLAESITGSEGRYFVDVPAGREVRIRALARMRQTGSPSWDFRVIDNTSDDLLYAIESETIALSGGNETVNLRADSGWDGARYSGPRAAAPFAILDAVYDAVRRVLEADPAVAFPALRLNWSPLNRESEVFDPDSGQILTTAYILDPLGTGIYVLGDENVDTDEYDAHVLAHEWGHYLEDRLARSDSTGGPHTLSARLDLRLAFSEGWSNAFAGMALEDPLYIDTFGFRQALGFSFDLEDNGGFNRGWYNESSVHSVLYDLYDDAADGVDATSLGFAPIYETLTTALADSAALTSIFSYAVPLKEANPDDASAIDALLEVQNIVGVGMDIWGSTETNDAGGEDVLPVYHDVGVNGEPVTVCSNSQFGTFNRTAVRQYLRFDVDLPGSHRISASGSGGSDPDIVLYRRGFLAISESSQPDREVITFELDNGVHVIEVYEWENLFSPGRGRTCFEVTVEVAG